MLKSDLVQTAKYSIKIWRRRKNYNTKLLYTTRMKFKLK